MHLAACHRQQLATVAGSICKSPIAGWYASLCYVHWPLKWLTSAMDQRPVAPEAASNMLNMKGRYRPALKATRMKPPAATSWLRIMAATATITLCKACSSTASCVSVPHFAHVAECLSMILALTQEADNTHAHALALRHDTQGFPCRGARPKRRRHNSTVLQCHN